MKQKTGRIVFFTAYLLILGLAASCQPQSANITTTPVVLTSAPSDKPEALPIATSTIEPTPDTDAAQVAIIKALLALNTQPNRMESTTIPTGGQAQKNVIEFVPPNRKHITSLGDGVEYIVIDQAVYEKTPSSGIWEKSQIPASTIMGEAQVTEAAIAQTISEARFARSEPLDGRSIMVFSYKSTTRSSGIDLHSLIELWIGEADGLPRQMIIDGEILSAATDPTTGKSTLAAVRAKTTTKITFDSTIKIEPPVLAPTPTNVANPTTLRQLVQGSDFVVSIKWMMAHQDTFDVPKTHANGVHNTLFMGQVMPSQPMELNNPASYNFSKIDAEFNSMQENNSKANSIYLSHVVDPLPLPQELPWLVDLYNTEKAANGSAAAQAKVTEIMTAYVANYLKHVKGLMQEHPQYERIMISVLSESGIKSGNLREGDDPLIVMMGPDYPEKIFDAARAAYPEALLGYTDNMNWTSGEQGEYTGLATATSLEMVNRLYRTGKMDYLGIEGIIDGSVPLDTKDMAATLAAYNCPIFVPEYQISELLMSGSPAQRNEQQAQMTHDFFSTIAATGKWLGVNFDAIGPYGFLEKPEKDIPFAGPGANSSLFDPVTFEPKIPGAYQAAFDVIKAYLGR